MKHNWDSNQLTIWKGCKKVLISLGTCWQRPHVAWLVIAETVNMVKGLEDDEEELFLKVNWNVVPIYLANLAGF